MTLPSSELAMTHLFSHSNTTASQILGEGVGISADIREYDLGIRLTGVTSAVRYHVRGQCELLLFRGDQRF